MEEKAIKPRYGIVNLERRKHRRFNIDLPVEYYLVESPTARSGRAANVSEGGLLIYFPQKVEIGQQLHLKLFFPSGSELNTIEMLAEVAWADTYLGKDWGDYRSGVQFIEISSDDLEKIKQFLRSLSE